MREMDTIAQIVTAAGRGAVGIVRLSGAQAVEIGAALYSGKSDLLKADSHTIHYGWVKDDAGKRVDEALFMIMRAPRSYTGEDVLEIQCHGGAVATGEVLRLALFAGARAAEAGEFTRRAFLNGKVDFTRAEAIMDLVDAKSSAMLSLAAEQKYGRLEEKIADLRAQLLELIAYLQADIDYPEDDIERLSHDTYLSRARDLEETLRSLIASGERGRLYRDGIRVAIAGRPNVGKSSLLNALAGRESAIVTDIPGTTRDIVRERLTIGGFYVDMLDTAGLRKATDTVEAIGIDRARETASSADLVLYVIDPMQGFSEEDAEMLGALAAEKVLIVHNKKDLGLSLPPLPEAFMALPAVHLSAKEETGMDDLSAEICRRAMAEAPESADSFYVTNVRHLSLLDVARKDLVQFQRGIEMGMPEDLLVIDLQHAWENLGLITGDTAAEDLLDEIFSKFCLGK